MSLPTDYLERIYAGVLGKIIGVYLGRPFEGWSHERIMAEFGEVWYYVHERRGVPLIVTDDDIAGTLTFLRALPDHDYQLSLTPAQIGETWLNYIIEHRTILWWGGMGNSTEHTAYLRLKHGIAAPRSGSMALNGQVVAEQIGPQIFVDGWAMVAPGDPERAAEFARRAALVSHDGEAVHGAQVIAAMEAQAFVESDLQRLIDTGLRIIPADSVIARLIHDVRDWHARDGDWRVTRERIAARYGYDRYGGNCHIVPNHALIHLGLLYGGDDLQRALMITNTAGWDTDCNAANVGCLLGIKNGLAAFDAGADLRTPVADRLYNSTADGGQAISDAVRESYAIANIGRRLAGMSPLNPKDGARFHFSLPGSVQGFRSDDAVDARGTLTIENVIDIRAPGERRLALHARGLGPGRVGRALSDTFIPPEAIAMPGYMLLASPTLHSGQMLTYALAADSANPSPLTVVPVVQVYDGADRLVPCYGPRVTLTPGHSRQLSWRVPDTDGQPIAAVGLEVQGVPHGGGTIYLDSLGWEGVPKLTFKRPAAGGTMWRRAWVDGVDQFDDWRIETYRLVQNAGTGLLMQGGREWRDYVVQADVTPHLVQACGIAVRVQGMRRYVALTLDHDERGGRVLRLTERIEDRQRIIEQPHAWEYGQTVHLQVRVAGREVHASAGTTAIMLDDLATALDGGAIGLLVSEGRVAFEDVAIAPCDVS